MGPLNGWEQRETETQDSDGGELRRPAVQDPVRGGTSPVEEPPLGPRPSADSLAGRPPLTWPLSSPREEEPTGVLGAAPQRV